MHIYSTHSFSYLLYVGKMILCVSLPHNSFAELPCVLRGYAALSDFELEVPPGMFHSSVHPSPGRFPGR